MKRKKIITLVGTIAVILSYTYRSTETLASSSIFPTILQLKNSKTNNEEIAFQVKQNEEITFRVKAKDAEKYIWLVNGKVQKETEDSFTWTVPQKEGIWKISVRAINKNVEILLKETLSQAGEIYKKTKKAVLSSYRPGQKPYQRWKNRTGKWTEGVLGPCYPHQCKGEWIVSTYYKEVKPGDSIQKILDSIPPTGGIVKLIKGKYELNSPLQIRKNNIALIGAGEGKTILTNANINITSGKEVQGITINKRVKSNNVADPGIRFRKYHWREAKYTSWIFNYPRSRLDFEKRGILRNITVGFLTLHRGNIAACDVVDLTLTDLTVEQGNIWAGATVHTIVRHCTLRKSRGGVFIIPSISGAIVDCDISVSSGLTTLQFNGASYSPYVELPEYLPPMMLRNKSDGGSGIFIYSSHTVLVKNNLCEKMHRLYGIGTRLSGLCLYTHNVIRNGKHGASGIYVDNGSAENIYMNNLIYGNSGHGVFLNQRRGPVRNNWFINNTIYGNKGDGIYNKQTHAPVAKNNIIVGNGGAGIRGEFKLVSYNNVWNNAGGNYKCAINEGNMSKDPLFADPDKGDFHLKSKAGRWDPKTKKWMKDDITSPCIDAGDPKDDFSKEPAPNGGRINMGAYGNTHHASKSQK